MPECTSLFTERTLAVRCRFWSAILSGVLFSSFALAQEASHFDLSGNLSFNGATLPSGASSTQVRALGWQTSGVTRLNRWFALTSQFDGSNASSGSMTFLGYTGPATMNRYSMLAGPRVSIPTRSRFSPFVEGLVGVDRASTRLTSSSALVTGNETQMAYAIGGGAQINLSRHFGLNFEGQYFGTQHTLTYTGWEPAKFQISAGIVIRMFNRGPQIAERSQPTPTVSASAEPTPAPTVTPNTESEAPAASAVANIQPVAPAAIVQAAVQTQPMAASDTRIPMRQQEPVARPAVEPAVAPVVAEPIETAKLVSAPVQVRTPMPVLTPAPRPSTPTASVVTPAAQAVAPAAQLNASQPAVRPAAQPPQATTPNAPVTVSQNFAQTQPQGQPMSLGEYARRLREKKQQQSH